LKDVTASNNATQQSLTGLGVQISKIAESFKFADTLAKFENTIKTELAATVNAVSHIEVKNDANVKAFSDLNARLDKMEFNFRASVDVEGVAALKSEIQKMSQTVSSGRDSNVQTIQFTKEFQAVLVKSYETQLEQVKSSHRSEMYQTWVFCGCIVAVTKALCAVICFQFRGSRNRALARAGEKK
jgi:nitrate reductase alpha subunit